MKLTNRRAVAGATMAALSITLFGACGGGDDDTASSEVASLDDQGSSSDSTPDTATDDSVSPEDREEALAEFAQCMRDHGVDMDDPQFDAQGGGGIELEATPENEDDIEAAQEACQPILEEAMGDLEIDPEQQAEMREQMLEYAQCMRDHGIDMPDPQFSDDGGFVIQAGPEVDKRGSGGGDPRDDPDFEAADEECRPEGAGPGAATGNTVIENGDG
jgi:hypothetical protein